MEFQPLNKLLIYTLVTLMVSVLYFHSGIIRKDIKVVDDILFKKSPSPIAKENSQYLSRKLEEVNTLHYSLYKSFIIDVFKFILCSGAS